MTQTDLTLYHGLASTCSKKVRMTLYEKDLPFESRLVNLQKFEQHDPDYLALNPAGVVPTLVHRGIPITESSIIVEYLEDSFPEIALVPPDPVERAQMRHWLKYSDNVSYDAVYISTWALLSAKSARALDEDQLDRMLSRVPTSARRDRWRKVAGDGFSASELEEARSKMESCLAGLDRALEPGPWLLGAAFSLADIANIPFVDRIRNLHPELLDGARYPALLAWEARLRARPAFARAFDFRDDPRAADLPNI